MKCNVCVSGATTHAHSNTSAVALRGRRRRAHTWLCTPVREHGVGCARGLTVAVEQCNSVHVRADVHRQDAPARCCSLREHEAALATWDDHVEGQGELVWENDRRLQLNPRQERLVTIARLNPARLSKTDT